MTSVLFLWAFQRNLFFSISPASGFNLTVSSTKSVVSTSFQQLTVSPVKRGVTLNPLSRVYSNAVQPGIVTTYSLLIMLSK